MSKGSSPPCALVRLNAIASNLFLSLPVSEDDAGWFFDAVLLYSNGESRLDEALGIPAPIHLCSIPGINMFSDGAGGVV